MQRTPPKSMRVTGTGSASYTCSMCSRTARPVARVTRSAYVARTAWCNTAETSIERITLRSALLLGNDQQDLRARERRQALGQRHVVVPGRDDRDAGRATPNGELAVPARHVIANALQSLSAAGIPEPAHALDQRGFQRRGVAPAVDEPSPVRRRQGCLESHARIRHRDHHHPPRQPSSPLIALDGDPAAGAGMLYNMLTRLRKRHSETHRRFRVDAELAWQTGSGALLDVTHDLVHVFGRAHRGDRQQDVRVGGGFGARHLAVNLEQVAGGEKKSGTP